MMRLLVVAFFGYLSGICHADLGKASPDQQITYKRVGDVELKMHVFLPKNHKPDDKRPAIVFFFGGGWNSGSPSQFYPHCEYLASRGMVAMAADYRVKSRQGTTPRECVKDGKSAVRWLRKNASKWGVDPDKIAAGGGSAGGHVAAATGTVKGLEEKGEVTTISSRPNALVLFNPVYDNGPGGYGHNRVKGYWQQISPMHNIGKHTPPTIVFLGTKDHLIPVATAETFQKKLTQAGVLSELHLYPGQTHGFFNFNKRKNFDDTIKKTDAFLVAAGILEQN